MALYFQQLHMLQCILDLTYTGQKNQSTKYIYEKQNKISF